MNDTPNTIMSIFKAFGAKKLPNIKLTKIGGASDKIPIGQVIEGTLASGEVKVGISFNIANAIIKEGGNDSVKNTKGAEYELWCTSIIEKILSENTFQTKNSIYKWEKI